jgi:hypothetical protein
VSIWVTKNNHDWVSEATGIPVDTINALYADARVEKKILTLRPQEEEPDEQHCIWCGQKILVMIFRLSGYCSEIHRKMHVAWKEAR